MLNSETEESYVINLRKRGIDIDFGFKPDKTFPLVAYNLKRLREWRNQSLDQVAKAVGISKTYLWELENDTDGKKMPSASVLFRLSCYFQADLVDLMLETRWDVLARDLTTPPPFHNAR